MEGFGGGAAHRTARPVGVKGAALSPPRKRRVILPEAGRLARHPRRPVLPHGAHSLLREGAAECCCGRAERV